MRRGINSYCAFGGQQIGAMWERPTSCCSESCTARKEEEMTSRANAAPTSNDLIKDRQRLDAARRQTERFWSWNWIFTHIRIKVILVFVLSVGHVEPRGGVTYRMSHKNGAETQNDPLTSRRNDLCLWVNVHTSSPAFWWTFLHQLVSFFLQHFLWKCQYFSEEIRLPYLWLWSLCSCSSFFSFHSRLQPLFFKLLTAPWDKLLYFKIFRGTSPPRNLHLRLKNIIYSDMLFIRNQISTVCLTADRKVFPSPLMETRTAGWTPPNAGDSPFQFCCTSVIPNWTLVPWVQNN